MILNRFTLYETRTRFFVTGSSSEEERYRILKIDRTDPINLTLTDDGITYTKAEVADILHMMDEGNKSSGGLSKVLTFFGIFGFVRFLEGYYMILITKRSTVALIGGHYVYHIDDTILFPLQMAKASINKQIDEARYLQIFGQIDLSKNFYYSHGYNISHTLQTNLSQPHTSLPPNDMFIWNRFLMKAAFPDPSSCWALPIIHGFVDQSKLSILGRTVFITLIGRRSRFFAGPRYLKRGVDDKGHVANEIEVEQIIHDNTTSTFTFGLDEDNPKISYTSFVQHRGSIPLYWSQDTTNMPPKPPIQLDLVDPYHVAASRHFSDLISRYGAPIVILNLVKAQEKFARESILLHEFTAAVQYLNQSIPKEHQMEYIPWDMSSASKRGTEQEVIGFLESIAENVLDTIGFFHIGREPFQNHLRERGSLTIGSNIIISSKRLQKGIVRTNCVDCLDRTNAAQFVIAKTVLAKQLYVLGVIPQKSIEFDTASIDLFNAMYQDLGDTIALQYGGSHLVNTMETYRKNAAWTSHSRDMIENIKRYYSNTFTDAEKQNAINLVLGNFIPYESDIPLWNLRSDHWFHYDAPGNQCLPKTYMNWVDSKLHNQQKEDLNEENKQLASLHSKKEERIKYYEEYYRPKFYTTLSKLYAHNMISCTTRDLDLMRGEYVDPLFGLSKQKNLLMNTNLENSREDVNQNQMEGMTHKMSHNIIASNSINKKRNQTEFLIQPYKDQKLMQNLVRDSLNPSVILQEALNYKRYVQVQRLFDNPPHMTFQGILPQSETISNSNDKILNNGSLNPYDSGFHSSSPLPQTQPSPIELPENKKISITPTLSRTPSPPISGFSLNKSLYRSRSHPNSPRIHHHGRHHSMDVVYHNNSRNTQNSHNNNSKQPQSNSYHLSTPFSPSRRPHMNVHYSVDEYFTKYIHQTP